MTIPLEDLGGDFRRLVPETYSENIDEHITPIAARVIVAHSDETQTRLVVREGGKHPAIVSVDGIN